MSQSSTAVSQLSLPWLPASRAARFFMAVLAGDALLAIAAHVAVPLFFTPVPFTLQTLALLLLGLLLEPSVAFATVAAYLIEGAAGLPVFAPVSAGSAFALLGPSAGYLWAYPFAAVAVSWLYRRANSTTFTAAALSAAAGSLVYFAGGCLWFAATLHQPLTIALDMTVWPFLAGDALKIILAAAMVSAFFRTRARKITEPAA